MLESLGGVKDTVTPMKESLKQNEMRPYEYVRDYSSALKNLKEQPSNFATQPSDVKLISASPYRASVLVVENRDECGPADDSSDNEKFKDSKCVTPMAEYKKQRTSPIRDDSQILRGRCDDFLTSFNQNNVTPPRPPNRLHSLSESNVGL